MRRQHLITSSIIIIGRCGGGGRGEGGGVGSGGDINSITCVT